MAHPFCWTISENLCLTVFVAQFGVKSPTFRNGKILLIEPPELLRAWYKDLEMRIIGLHKDTCNFQDDLSYISAQPTLMRGAHEEDAMRLLHNRTARILFIIFQASVRMN